DNTPRINKETGYDNQRVVNVTGARDNVGTKDAAYHKEKMLLCKQEEAGFELNAEQDNWMNDTDDELDDQELEAHYMYMAQIQEVTADAADNYGPIFDTEPLQKVQNDDDHYNVFANDKEHPEQPEYINDTYLEEQGDTNITIDSLDMSTNGETIDQDEDDLANKRDLLASLIDKLKCEIDDSKNRNKFLESSNKTLVDKLKDLKKFQDELAKRHDVNYMSKVELECAKAKTELMNAILGMYTTLDEFTDLQCDYVDQVVRCERLDKELSKSNTTSKSFKSLQQHAIDLELALQQCQEQIKNDKTFKENQSKVFQKEREQYFEIQDLKVQLQDKGIAISELKKLIQKLKGKSVETKFKKPSVIRQPNAFKSQTQSILVAFRKSTCYIRDLKGNDLLKGSRGTDLYSITLQDSTTPNPICLMAKATHHHSMVLAIVSI
ncbi:hypothetical protein Tco_0270127, partial [Tanacetum coccineum]